MPLLPSNMKEMQPTLSIRVMDAKSTAEGSLLTVSLAELKSLGFPADLAEVKVAKLAVLMQMLSLRRFNVSCDTSSKTWKTSAEERHGLRNKP